jgi:hypothetical protein
MKVIGIDIDKSKAIFYVLEKKKDGEIVQIEGLKSLTLANDTDNSQVRAFKTGIQEFFDEIKPQGISLLSRQTKGRFKAASVSFKIEGLIQCYEKVEVNFVSPQTVKAFIKKNPLTINLDFNYQEGAAELAYYMCTTLGN